MHLKTFVLWLALPDADVLVLVGQVDSVAVVEVERAHLVGGGVKEVLSATLWGQVGIVAGILGHLYMKKMFITLT